MGFSSLITSHGQSIFSTGEVSRILSATDGLPFRMSEGSIWTVDNDTQAEGASLRSGVIGDNGVTSFELPSVPGGQAVTWSVRVSSEQVHDAFRFFVNGSEVESLRKSGTMDWTELSYALPSLESATPGNIVATGDIITASTTNSPSAEPVENLLDGNPATIYRNFDKQNVAITVTPRSGRSVVTGLRLTTRDYAPERAPASWEIHGSEDGTTFEKIASGTVPSVTTSGSPTIGIPTPSTGSLLREVFLGVTGSTLNQLTNSTPFLQGTSTSSQLTPLLETSSNLGDNYGQRIRGYLIPPATGTYRFWIASDDQSTLMLSTDDSVRNAREIASVPDWSASRDWTKFTSQRSADIQLIANRAYYMEVLHKDGGGADSLAVGWQLPSGVAQRVTHNVVRSDDAFISINGGIAFSGETPGLSPQSEFVNKAFDRNAQTKFLVYRTTQMGIQVAPKTRDSVVTSLAVTTANDAPYRDPTLYEIYGSNNGGGSWETIATGAIAAISDRGFRRVFPFSNNKAFGDYRILLKRSTSLDHMQVAEVELLEGNGLERPMPTSYFIPLGSTLPSVSSTTTTQDLTFSNTKSFLTYRILFPTLRSASEANSLQVADIGLLGIPAGYTLKWAYQKDRANTAGSDAAWVDRLRLNYWPAVLTQPVGGVVLPGSTLRLTTQVRGGTGAGILWLKDGIPLSDGGRITGTTTKELTITSAVGADSGRYTCRVMNPVGTAESQAAEVIVPLPPAITLQPTGSTLDLNAGLNLSVSAIGTAPLTYVWRRDGTIIPGATAATFSVANVNASHAGNYTVTVTNAYGSVQSTSVSVMVRTLPVITTQPVSVAGVTGQALTLSVVATSSIQPVTYQWKKSGVNVVESTRIQGANSARVTFSGLELADAGDYTLEVVNEAGAVTSSTAVLTVTPRNLAPTLDEITDKSIVEDAPATTVALSGITDGNGGGQSLVVTATSSNPLILPNPVVTYTNPSATGSLALVSAAGKSGTVVVTVRVQDNGGTVDGAVNLIERQFTVSVLSQNDPPTLNALSAVSVLDSGVEPGTSFVDSLSSSPTNGVLRGDAAWVSDNGGRIRLTPASVSKGLFFLPDFNPGRAVRGFTARFRMLMDQGSSSPADGMSFNFMPEDPSTVDLGGSFETGAGSGLSIGFGIYQNPYAVLRVNGQEVARKSAFSVYNVGSTTAMPWVEVVFSPDRKVTVWFNDTLVFDAVQTTLDPAVGWRFGWAARCGGQYARQSIDEISLYTFLERVRERSNVLQPSDAITSLMGSSPSGEGIANAIDGTTQKFLVLGTSGMAFMVTPGVGPTIVNALAITSGNDFPQRDPADFAILGSIGGLGWEHIAAGQIPADPRRNYRRVLEFANSKAFERYLIRFNRPQQNYDHMQVAELELLGRKPVSVSLLGITDGDDGRQMLTITATSQTASVTPAPTVNYLSPQSTGLLVFPEAPAGANGTTQIKVRVQDDGGTDNGGVNFLERTFDLTVMPINQAPTLEPIETVAVDTSSAITVDVPILNISAGGDALSRTVTVTATSETGTEKTLTLSPTVTYASPATTGKVSFTIGQGIAGVATVKVTVTDQGGTANGGVNSIMRSFAVKAGPQPPVIETPPANVMAVPGDKVILSVKASGIDLNYQWSKDGALIVGATGATLELPSVGASAVGIYSVRVSNSNLDNQNPSASAFLGLWTPPAPTDIQATQQAQFASPLTLPAGFTVSRQWMMDGVDLSGATQENLTIGTATTASVGAYSVRITATSPTLGSVTFTTPPVPLRLFSDITTLYSTGIGTNGLRLTDRASDPHYTLIEPSPITGPAVAVVTSGTFPTPPWIVGGTNSAWISPSARLRELGTATGSEYIYRTTFNLNGIDLNTLRIQGKVAADDTVSAIRLNGIALTTPGSIGFDGYKNFDFTPGSTRYGDRFLERGFLGTGRHVAVTGDTSGTTGEDGEPLPLGAGVHGSIGSVWWTWRAPSNCRVTVTTEGSQIPTILSVFEGIALDRLRHLGSADGAGAAATTIRSVTFTGISGRDYPIRLDGYQAAEGAVRVVVRAENLDANGQVTGTVPSLVVLPPGLLPGENTLDFVVRNTPDSGLDRSLTGLRVEFTSVQGVPRPVMLVASPTGGVETYGNRKSFVAQVVSGTPVTYEWYRDGQRIEGADEATLTFNRVEEEDAGTYTVRIQNLNGSIWTTPVPFEVDVPLTITAQPGDQNVKVGGSTQFSLRFRGNPPLSVQWYRNGEPIQGATGTNYTIASATVAQVGRYHAVVSDRDDFQATTEAVLNVLEPPQLVQEPLDVSGVSGVDSLRMETIVDGSRPLRYLWFRNDVPLAVENASTLNLGLLRPSHAGQYHLLATNLVGAVVSRKATVTVHEPPAVVSGSGNVKIFEGEKATFSVNASGSGDLDYTWYVAGTIVPTAKGNSLDLDGLTRGQTGEVAVVVRSAYGVVTNTYTLEVFQAPIPVVSTGINRSQEFVLKPGWNAIFLEVQPEKNDVPTVFKDIPFTSLWRWSDPRTGPQFVADQSEAKLDVARWQIHLPTTRPESFQNNLAAVFRHEAYLLNLSGTQNVTLSITGKPGYQRSRWAVDGYTLTGLPIDPEWPNGGPSVIDFFSPSTAHFDAATSQPRGLYRLQSNGSWVPLTATNTLKSGEAYWIYTRGGSDYLAPVEAEIPGITEITYTLGGDQKELAFSFRTNSVGGSVQNVFLSHWLPDQSLPLRINEFAPQEGSSWRDLPNGYSVSPTQGTRRTIRLAASRDRVPGLLYEGVLTLKAGGIRHVVPLTVQRDKPDTVAQASRPFNPVGLWMGTVRITHVSEVNGLKTNYTVVYDTNRVDGVETVVARATTEVRNVQQGSLPTPVKEPFDMRLILHTGVDGISRILQSVTLLKKADSVTVANQVVTSQQGGDAVLISDPSLLGSFEGVTLRGRDKIGGRFSTPFYPMYQTNGIPFDAGLDLGRRIQASWSLPPGAPLNPYRHKYHPDHDNLDRNFQTYKAEAYPVRRTVVLDIPARQGSTRKPGAGQDEIEGVYTEVIEGVHRIPITVQGTVALKRLIAVGVLNPTP